MRVKSISLDGFKSYAHLQELSDLHPHFNAITGYNGSGKSNIFDAICFVMGITNLKKVRADDTRDLIYKAGAAGVQVARVVIEFINDDPNTAPPGYPPSQYPTICVGRHTQLGGKQRYYLDQKQIEQAKLKRFFQNIGLNVDNPHFMVLQGTVHRLIGMKSADILALVEEAVGTRTFDVRSRTAENLMKSKERRIEEIDRNIDRIRPNLEAKRALIEDEANFAKATESLEHKRQFKIAFEYWHLQTARQTHQSKQESRKSEVAASKATLQSLPTLMDEARKRVMLLQGNIKQLEDEEVQLHTSESEPKKEQVKVEVLLKNCSRTLDEMKKATQQLAAEQKSLDTDAAKLKKLTATREALKEEIRKGESEIEEIKQSRRLLKSGVEAGLSGKSGAEERAMLEDETTRLQGESHRLNERRTALHNQMASLRQAAKNHASDAQQLEQALQKQQARRDDLARQYAPYEALEKQMQEVDQRWSSATRKLQAAEAEQSGAAHNQLQFHYQPIAGHDLEASIHGRLGELIKPKNPEHSLALSVGSVQHLMKVVVDTDEVASLLIERGGLRTRTTFFPLNRTTGPRIEAKRFEEAAKAAQRINGMVSLARDLIKFDPKFDCVIDAAFGGFVVCSDIALAKVIAFTPSIGLKAVTLGGETVEPQGIMTGGTRPEDILLRFQQQASQGAPLAMLRKQVSSLDRERDELQRKWQQGSSILRMRDDAEALVVSAEQRLRGAGSSHTDRLEAAEKEMTSLEQRLHAIAERQTVLVAKRKELDALGGLNNAQLDEQYVARLKAITVSVEDHKKRLHADSATLDHLEANVEQREQDFSQRHGELERETAAQASEQVTLQTKLTQLEAQLEGIRQRRRQVLVEREAVSAELQTADHEVVSLTEHGDQLAVKIREMEEEIKRMLKSGDEVQSKVKDFERRHTWIANAASTFGPVNGPFYFDDEARTEATLQEIREAEALIDSIANRVKKRTVSLYDGLEKDHDELVAKRATFDEDRQSLLEVIKKVEVRKWEALDRMVQSVSRQFSALFSSCLPGAAAKLVEERGSDGHIVGLQVRVLFNGKEKESLTELSGGQRSLLALCLILAILCLKPAPIYILDEVDAALDPSHTQNIGRMLQEHFSKSQFLLVSLKDGMFNNANVLYEVRNTQGFSEVTRREVTKK